jgi:hypothetical protein
MLVTLRQEVNTPVVAATHFEKALTHTFSLSEPGLLEAPLSRSKWLIAKQTQS